MPLLNYETMPLNFPESRLQLLPASSFFGFTEAIFQGRRPWKWETLFRPFLRIGQFPQGDIESHPDLIVIKNEKLSLRVLSHSSDAVKIMIDAEEPSLLHLGPGGRRENFGGIQEQEYLIYWGYADSVNAEGNIVKSRVEGSAGVFCAQSQCAVELCASGCRIALRKGENHFGFAAGYATDIEKLGKAASAARDADAEELKRRNRDKWDRLFEKGSDLASGRYDGHARCAVWTIAASTYPPEGIWKRTALAASPPCYDKRQFLWDTCFAVRGYARFDTEMCKGWLRIFMDSQLDNGMILGSIGPWDNAVGGKTQVPLFSWAANAIYEADGDKVFLEEAFRAAVRYNDWWMGQGDPECSGLPATKPISYDNTPLYDPFRIETMNASASLVLPDIIAALYNDCHEIAVMARRLDRPDTEKIMIGRASFLAQEGHRRLYDTESEYYYASHKGSRICMKTGPALAALSFAPRDVAERIAQRYLRPGSGAWPLRGVATVLADEPAFDPENFWRGMIWTCTNRLIIDALERAGLEDHAINLALETISLIAEADNFYEVYNPMTGRGCRGKMMTGFGAGVFLDLLAKYGGEGS